MSSDAPEPRCLCPWPGGKTTLAPWVIDHLPAHRTFVDVTGGGGSILVQKPESRVEILNDRDGDLVHFWRVLRERDDELREWCRHVPYARDTHQRFARQFYEGYRPSDDVERAGRFLYLRVSQYAGKYHGVSGFGSSQNRNEARKWDRWTEQIPELKDRLRNVQIENRDWRAILDRFDDDATLCYVDPPYPDAGEHLYREGEQFDHGELARRLAELEGDWLVSYEGVPDAVERAAEAVVCRTDGHTEADDRERVERLAVSFDPSTTPSWVDTARGAGRQSRLAEL